MQRVSKSVNTKSRRFCSVPQCSSYCTKDVSLHNFPINNKKLCNKWKNVLKIDKPISKYMLVCSKHFVAEDFTLATAFSKLRRLKKNVVPSQNIPITSHSQQNFNQIDRQRTWLNSKREDHEIDLQKSIFDEVDVTILPSTNKTSYIEYESMNAEKPVFHMFEDKATQTDFCDFFELPQILNTDEKLMTFIGVNEAVLNTYEKCTESVIKENGNIGDLKNLRLKLILVLCKLKLNITFACLAILFNISNSTCTRYFHSTVTLLATSIKPAIYWPSKGEILKNMPKCFEKYRQTRVVLDCTEIKLQKFRCLKCRVLSYSHYKGTNTIKYLIGIAPSGLITYISPGYGGRATDKAIFNAEEVINKVDPNDAIMVDKGILIEKECEENLVRLIRPPFLRKNKQLSKVDAEATANIARARVHVERAIQRVKLFHIVSGQVDWFLVPYIDDIMNVIVASVNLSPPILSDEKFSYGCCESGYFSYEFLSD